MSSVGDLVCWGSNTYGQSSVPTEVFSDVSSGGFHTCGITNSGAVLCWGYDFFGQVSNTPQGNNYTKVSAGEYSTCAVTTTDSIECWGRDSSGQASPPVFPLTP
jgi:alpha-tubulin suppressor-like RCC1 family protein